MEYENVALIFAGGVGSRMGGDVPKQFLEWNGKAVLVSTLEVFERCRKIDDIVIACKEDWIDYTWELIKKAGLRKVSAVVPGGETALDSQYLGLCEIKKHRDEAVVLIHDGVRPLVDEDTILRCIESAGRFGNAVTVTKAIETVIRVDENGAVTEILDREMCRMAKAPQCFMLSEILGVHERSMREGRHDFIDSASMMMAHGVELHTVFGGQENIKITTPSDYYMYLGISHARDEK